MTRIKEKEQTTNTGEGWTCYADVRQVGVFGALWVEADLAQTIRDYLGQQKSSSVHQNRL